MLPVAALLPFPGDTRGPGACLGRPRPGVNPSGETREMVTPLEALARKLAGETPAGQRRTMPAPSWVEIDHPVALDRELMTILAMPLDEFDSHGKLLEVQVPWLGVTLWFVSEERDAEALVLDGVIRGRVWTATELMDVMAISERTSEALWAIALAKLAFDGDIAAVIPRSGR
jgi:hypothetical protein